MKFFIASALLAMGSTASRSARSQLSKEPLVNDDTHEATDTTPEAVTGFAAPRTQFYEPDNSARTGSISITSGERDLDIGILSRTNQEEWDASFINSRRLQASSCTSGSVVCVGGYNRDNPSQTCADACAPNNNCCVGTKACDNFTGTVCMDGESCMGDRACHYANITNVVKGCKEIDACHCAGDKGGFIGLVDNSCQGISACNGTAKEGGSIDFIVDSCNGKYACEYAAAAGSDEDGEEWGPGRITRISDSCIGYKSCYAMAIFDGYVGSIFYSCHGTNSSCCSAGGYGGSIDSIMVSCNGTKACKYTAELYGTIGTISDSCVGDKACYGTAYRGGVIENITSSCNGQLACSYIAAYYGDILGFRQACNAAEACSNLNRGPEKGEKEDALDPIESVLNNCCNNAEACENLGTLPNECLATMLTPAPSKAPTSSPTKAPTKRPTKSPTSRTKSAKRGKSEKSGKENKASKRSKTYLNMDAAALVEEKGEDENSSKSNFVVERKRVHEYGGAEGNHGLRSGSDKNRV